MCKSLDFFNHVITTRVIRLLTIQIKLCLPQIFICEDFLRAARINIAENL